MLEPLGTYLRHWPMLKSGLLGPSVRTEAEPAARVKLREPFSERFVVIHDSTLSQQYVEA